MVKISLWSEQKLHDLSYLYQNLFQHSFYKVFAAWSKLDLSICIFVASWWRHVMETLASLLAICAEFHRSPVEPTHEWLVMRRFDVSCCQPEEVIAQKSSLGSCIVTVMSKLVTCLLIIKPNSYLPKLKLAILATSFVIKSNYWYNGRFKEYSRVGFGNIQENVIGKVYGPKLSLFIQIIDFGRFQFHACRHAWNCRQFLFVKIYILPRN